ncbi:hypothetical protein VW29_02495 [Devosia limi DSM 17137]|uniref:Uncharacterized protein n=1 Tax=Devosia limi DSM 17137 TaxID=1121477 RepID=A0A0F5LW77_9HYPH|nr:hypothetical protein [Devosia limi]KKB86449.1 hypothetical protein VW29_02495 [Devosia limi DSM 17137]SHE88662.1 hypothetical protein SAMN02745223_01323 [Devosia limi DSM 17137]
MASYDLNDLHTDLTNMGELIDTVAETILGCDFGPPGARVPHMDRLNALICIARDQMEKLNGLVDDNFVEIGSTVVGRR